MTIRNLKRSDLPELQRLADESGFPYPDLAHPHIEGAEVVTDAQGRIIMACVAKRLVEAYLYVSSEHSAAVSMAALRLLHERMAETLSEKGYNSIEGFIPPPLCAKFGRRLQRTFGWLRNWPSFCKHF